MRKIRGCLINLILLAVLLIVAGWGYGQFERWYAVQHCRATSELPGLCAWVIR